MKAMGVGLWAFDYRDVEVVRASSGVPSLCTVHGEGRSPR